MKIALVTTTIRVPTVLALYRKYGPDVMFFVVGDRKSPDQEIVDFLDDISDYVYYGIDWQRSLSYKCSPLIGENCIQRRNIGFLEALKWGADIVVSLDDDNIPMDDSYFDDFERVLSSPFDGLQVGTNGDGWFDVGRLQFTQRGGTVCQRGIPQHQPRTGIVRFTTGAKVGVAQGLCLGDPDTSAVDRMSQHPEIHNVSELLCSGVVVDSRVTKTVWNSQNTAIVRELVPAWFMLPHIGRYDDVLGSLICQRIMREHGYVAHFGRPFVWQSRNDHNLTKDLTLELLGMQTIDEFVRALDEIDLTGFATVLGQVRHVYSVLHTTFDQLPRAAFTAALAWCDDCEKVL